MKDTKVSPVAWTVSGDASLQEIIEHPDTHPLLRNSLAKTVSWQVRNETLVRVAVFSPRVAPQWVAALLALGATVELDADDGPQEVLLADLLRGDTRGRVASVSVSPGTTDHRWGEARVARTPADEPIAAAVAVVELDDGKVSQVRLALTGVWQESVRLAETAASLAGGALDEGRILSVAEAVEQEVDPRGDFMGSVDYRRAMAGVLARRALEHCLEAGDE